MKGEGDWCELSILIWHIIIFSFVQHITGYTLTCFILVLQCLNAYSQLWWFDKYNLKHVSQHCPEEQWTKLEKTQTKWVKTSVHKSLREYCWLQDKAQEVWVKIWSSITTPMKKEVCHLMKGGVQLKEKLKDNRG